MVWTGYGCVGAGSDLSLYLVENRTKSGTDHFDRCRDNCLHSVCNGVLATSRTESNRGKHRISGSERCRIHVGQGMDYSGSAVPWSKHSDVRAPGVAMDLDQNLTPTSKRPRARAPGRFLFYVRVGRIELPSSAWKADILPLNHTRIAIKI